MLPAPYRMRRSAEFDAAVRGGRRAGRPTLVVHQHVGAEQGVLVGFVVSRGVGSAVVRNSVKRRLRAAMAQRVPSLPAGSRTVVRANPAAAQATYAALVDDLDTALNRLGGRR